jgi:hypothetical protein
MLVSSYGIKIPGLQFRVRIMHNKAKYSNNKMECKYTAKCTRGTVLLESTQITWFSERSDRRLDIERGC